MSSINSITVEQLARLVGTPRCPVLVDVRTDGDFASYQRLLPASIRRPFIDAARWGAELHGRSSVVICAHGKGLSHGAAAILRHNGVPADVLEGGFEAWKAAGQSLVPEAKLPRRNADGRTMWVTRERPKIDRVACPWLIRRFIDPAAIFLFVKASEVLPVSERFEAAPFDIEGVHWSHRGDRCTFDVMIEEFGLATAPLLRLAEIVRGADTARLDIAPQAPGLLAVSLGLSRMYDDDLAQLDAGMLLYDAFYRWCRDATDETHNWPTNKLRGSR
jgi:rhodanese-related sulfurtransferase